MEVSPHSICKLVSSSRRLGRKIHERIAHECRFLAGGRESREALHTPLRCEKVGSDMVQYDWKQHLRLRERHDKGRQAVQVNHGRQTFRDNGSSKNGTIPLSGRRGIQHRWQERRVAAIAFERFARVDGEALSF